ncbi:MAG: hypothetical protein IPP52_12740 [Ignavibacteria bacterium]|nr:hypothetical protein [Ignavibacteria bacterium]
MYGGDVNQDGVVDAGDLSAVDNDAAESLSGYVSTDVNGDDFVMRVTSVLWIIMLH